MDVIEMDRMQAQICELTAEMARLEAYVNNGGGGGGGTIYPEKMMFYPNAELIDTISDTGDMGASWEKPAYSTTVVDIKPTQSVTKTYEKVTGNSGYRLVVTSIYRLDAVYNSDTPKQSQSYAYIETQQYEQVITSKNNNTLIATPNLKYSQAVFRPASGPITNGSASTGILINSNSMIISDQSNATSLQVTIGKISLKGGSYMSEECWNMLENVRYDYKAYVWKIPNDPDPGYTERPVYNMLNDYL